MNALPISIEASEEASRRPVKLEGHSLKTALTATPNHRQFLGQLGKLGFTAGLLGLPPEAQPLLASPPPKPICADAPPGAEFIHWSATKLAKAMREKKLSSEEVVRAYICRIEAVNRKIKAVIQLAAERALAEAREADAGLARNEVKGPLHGVPMTIKDFFETAGVITASGSLFHQNYVPTEDATLVARLRAAGAILLGKTNVPWDGGVE